jgi:hypothetical protein
VALDALANAACIVSVHAGVVFAILDTRSFAAACRDLRGRPRRGARTIPVPIASIGGVVAVRDRRLPYRSAKR